MSHWLPAIEIATKHDPGALLDGLAELALATQRFEVDRLRDALGIAGFQAVNLRLREDGPHEDLSIQLLSVPERPTPIQVELRAHRWSPDPPTFVSYIEAAHSLLGPLLRAWNKVHARRYRLRVERHGSDQFKMTARTAHLLDRFALLANRSSLHPLDWNRFYLLVREGRQRIPEHKLRGGVDREGLFLG